MMMRFWFVFIFMFLPAICWGQIIVNKFNLSKIVYIMI